MALTPGKTYTETYTVLPTYTLMNNPLTFPTVVALSLWAPLLSYYGNHIAAGLTLLLAIMFIITDTSMKATQEAVNVAKDALSGWKESNRHNLQLIEQINKIRP